MKAALSFLVVALGLALCGCDSTRTVRDGGVYPDGAPLDAGIDAGEAGAE